MMMRLSFILYERRSWIMTLSRIVLGRTQFGSSGFLGVFAPGFAVQSFQFLNFVELFLKLVPSSGSFAGRRFKVRFWRKVWHILKSSNILIFLKGTNKGSNFRKFRFELNSNSQNGQMLCLKSSSIKHTHTRHSFSVANFWKNKNLNSKFTSNYAFVVLQNRSIWTSFQKEPELQTKFKNKKFAELFYGPCSTQKRRKTDLLRCCPFSFKPNELDLCLSILNGSHRICSSEIWKMALRKKWLELAFRH